jgi:hypothetical protein
MDGREFEWIGALSENWSGPLQLRVRGRSMWPTLRPGDQVTVEPATADDLRPGDWVLLQRHEGLFLHRLLGFTKRGALLTKGDGHRAPDAPWPPQALRGRAVALSRQGRTNHTSAAGHSLVACTSGRVSYPLICPNPSDSQSRRGADLLRSHSNRKERPRHLGDGQRGGHAGV